MRNILTSCTGLKILLGFGIMCLVSSCIPVAAPHGSPQPGGTQQAGVKALPKIDITPPANFTKGAPEYTMRFHTLASGNYVRRTAQLRLISHPEPTGGASPVAYHMLPAGMHMGEYLPLLPQERSAPTGHTTAGDPERITIKYYWGCDDAVRKGQPRVQDSGKVSAGERGKSGEHVSSYGSASGLKPGWVEVNWPNREDSREVPSSASLVGEHFIHGNFLPHIRFSMDSRHDLPGDLSARAEQTLLKEAIPISWNKLPAAIGYHVTAMTFNAARKETIIWSSSEKGDMIHAGHFLPTPQVRRYISEKVILPADRDRCVIPKGIFSEGDNVTVTVTAWGEDYWASQPPRPADAPKNWKPDWVVKGQFLSTAHLMLGQHMGGAQPAAGQAHQDGAAPSRPGRPFGRLF